MLVLQRHLGSKNDSVWDGRYIGTVVFPKAENKFYLDASLQERVRRRYEELKDLGQKVTFEEVAAHLSKRNTIDSTRRYARLMKAKDAIYIDTTNMSIEEVAKVVLSRISSKG